MDMDILVLPHIYKLVVEVPVLLVRMEHIQELCQLHMVELVELDCNII